MSFDPNHNPWKVLESKVVYQNPWITVREDKVLNPNGNPGIYGVVQTRIAVGVVAINSIQEVYMVGQYRYPMNEYSWEIVEGGGEPGESAIETAKRELKEEVGVAAGTIVSLGADLHLSNCHSDERAYLFLVTDVSEGRVDPEDTEALRVQKVPFKQCIDWCYDGTIKDALSIVGITRAAHYLEK